MKTLKGHSTKPRPTQIWTNSATHSELCGNRFSCYYMPQPPSILFRSHFLSPKHGSICVSQHPPARPQIVPIVFFALWPHVLHDQNRIVPIVFTTSRPLDLLIDGQERSHYHDGCTVWWRRRPTLWAPSMKLQWRERESVRIFFLSWWG